METPWALCLGGETRQQHITPKFDPEAYAIPPQICPNRPQHMLKLGMLVVPGRLLGQLGEFWGVLGGVLGRSGASWAVLGVSCLEPSWGRPGGVLEASWAVLGASWAVFGASWSVLGVSWAVLRRLGSVLRPSWRDLAP